MEVSLLSWNVRGVGNMVSKGNLNIMVKKRRINILCIQETKCSSWNDTLKKSIWDLNSHDWVVQNSKGLSGGASSFLG